MCFGEWCITHFKAQNNQESHSAITLMIWYPGQGIRKPPGDRKSAKIEIDPTLVSLLSESYHNANRQNSDPNALGDEDKMKDAENKKKMQTAIMAILYHETKSSDNERYKYCPDGADSRCPAQTRR